jgi:hypothetical protein
MYFPISDWFLAFLVTLVIEAPIVVVLVRHVDRDLLRLGIVLVFANLATHLAVWYVITQLLLVGTWQYLLVAETWAVLAEALIYWAAVRGLSARRALAVAAVANVTSFAAGRLLVALWPHAFG